MKLFFFIAGFFACTICYAQKGTFTISFAPAVAAKNTITADLSGLIKNTYTINDYSAYWFINPHTNLHHVSIGLNNKQGGTASFLMSSIEFNSTGNDFTFWDHPHPNSDSNFFSISKALYVVSAPLEYDEPAYGGTTNHNGPIKIHIITFTSSELEFDITGTAEYGTKEDDGKFLGYGTIQGHGHFYRQGGYEKSPVYPGCDCDPTIYAQRYDVEEGNVRTASACEAIYLNKIFNAAKQSLAPLYGMSFSGSGKAPSGSIMLRKGPHYDISPEADEKANWPFEYDYKTNISRSYINQKVYYNDDGYGIELDEMPGDGQVDALKTADNAAAADVMKAMQNSGMAEKQKKIDSLGKLVQAKKITLQEYSDQIRAMMAPVTEKMNAATSSANKKIADGPDFKKMNMESMMNISISFNPIGTYFLPIDKSISKPDVQVLHTVAGAAYVIRAPAVKTGDGNWDDNKCIVLLGKYTAPPVVGRHDDYYTYAINATPVYPLNPNKLVVYNVAIKMVGGKDQIEKALTNMDFNALQQLITEQ